MMVVLLLLELVVVDVEMLNEKVHLTKDVVLVMVLLDKDDDDDDDLLLDFD
jgi:hypothetical protein